jgi:predicted MFS family arabinose efflux permease
MRGHLRDVKPRGATALIELLSRRRLWIAYALGGLPFLSVFLIIPNISPYVQINLGFPRARLDLLYLIGGGLSFFGTRVTGRLVDRIGATPVTVAATLLLTVIMLLCFVTRIPSIPVIAIFPLFMLVSSSRFVATSATLTKLPAAAERAGFMSLLSAIQNLASTAGSFVAAQMLTMRPDGALENMAAVALLSIAVGLAIPMLMWSVEGSIRSQARALQT